MSIDIKDAVEKLNLIDPIGRPGDDLTKLAATGVTGPAIIDKFQAHENDRSRVFYYVNLSEAKNMAYFNGMDVMVVKNFPNGTFDGISTSELEKRLIELSPSIRNRSVNPYGTSELLDKHLDELALDMRTLEVSNKAVYQKFSMIFDIVTVNPMTEDVRNAMDKMSNKELLKNWFKSDYDLTLREAYNMLAHPKDPRPVHKENNSYNEKFVGWYVLDMKAEKEGKVKYPMLKYADENNGKAGLPLAALDAKLQTFVNLSETQDQKTREDLVKKLAQGETVKLTPIGSSKYETVDGFVDPAKKTMAFLDSDNKRISHEQFKKVPSQEQEQGQPLSSQEQGATDTVRNQFLSRVPAPQTTQRPAGDTNSQGVKL